MAPERAITVGRSNQCDVVLDDASVSRRHARVALTSNGYLKVEDLSSTNGTWLKRAGRWTRARIAHLGRQDGVRFGECEVGMDRLTETFGDTVTVRLRAGSNRLSDRLLANLPEVKPVLENPRRNPITGNVEES